MRFVCVVTPPRRWVAVAATAEASQTPQTQRHSALQHISSALAQQGEFYAYLLRLV